MSRVQIILILIAGFAAVMVLVRLMLAQRNALWKRLQTEAEAAQAEAKKRAAVQPQRRRSA